MRVSSIVPLNLWQCRFKRKTSIPNPICLNCLKIVHLCLTLVVRKYLVFKDLAVVWVENCDYPEEVFHYWMCSYIVVLWQLYMWLLHLNFFVVCTVLFLFLSSPNPRQYPGATAKPNYVASSSCLKKGNFGSSFIT